MTSLDPRAKHVAYSNYIQVGPRRPLQHHLDVVGVGATCPAPTLAHSHSVQVVRSRTARGMVPNYSAGGTKSVDRTEPPIGAKVLLEMHRRYADAWLVELLFDDLLRWLG